MIPPSPAATQAADQIGRISVPVPVESGATFPLVSDYGYGMTQDWKIVEHRFGELATMAIQRYGVGSGARHFQFLKSVLNYTDRQSLLDFYDLVQGSFASFTYPVPNTDRTTFTNYEVVFDTPPVSITDLANRAQTGLTFTEFISTANAPTYDVIEVDSRFPSAALAQALASEVQVIIPLVHMKVRNTDVPDIYFSDRRVNIAGFPGATGTQLFQPRLLSVGIPGTSDVLMSQSMDSRAENVRFVFGNADRAMSALTNDCSITFAEIDLSLLHVGTGILLQLWKGIIVSWQIDGSSQMSVQCSDGLYPITQTYPPRVVSRQCWKPFNTDVLPGYRPCPWATAGNGQGNSTSCDYGFATSNGCLSHGMSNYFGGHPEQPQNVLIEDDGSGIIFGLFRQMVTSTSILSDSIWGLPLPEIWCNDLGSPQRAFWANCFIAAVRNESTFYDLLGIVGAGPIGAFEGMSVQTNSDGYKFVVAPTADGFYPQGFKVDSNLNITSSPLNFDLGLRQSVGNDPALLGVNGFEGQDAFSLGQGTPQNWAEATGNSLTNISMPGFMLPYAAGTALTELRYLTSPGTGIVPTTTEQHNMQVPIRMGLTGSVFDANGNWSASPGCVNPYWVAANTYLRALGINHADPATQLSYLVLDSITNAQGTGAADIASQWVNPIVGTTIPSFEITAAGQALLYYNLDYWNGTFSYQNSAGATVSIQLAEAIAQGYVATLNVQPNTEPQFMFQGTLAQSKPFRDWMNEILNCALGWWCFEFGQLKLGCRYNAIPTDSFTVGSMLYQSLTITPIIGAFEYLKINFANVELQYQADLSEYEDKDHAVYFGRGATPLTSQMNSTGISTLSQGLRVAVTRVREEVGGILREDLASSGNQYIEYDQNKRVSFRSTLLALDNEIGQVISVTHPDLATYPGAPPGSAAGSNGPFPPNTWPFRIKKWMLHSDWSVSILADSCVDSMYDLDTGPLPTGVGPRPLPVLFYPEPLGQWAPAQVQASPDDALFPNEYNFNLQQTFQYQGDGTLLTSAVVAGILPVNQFIPNCGAPDLQKGNVSWSATAAGGSIPGGTTLFVQVCMAVWDTTPAIPVVQQYSPPSAILVFQLPPGSDTNSITINNIVWPNSSLQNLGWVLFCNSIEDLICGQESGLGLPTSITFNGPVQRQTYAVPDPDVATLRLRAQVLVHGGVVGGGVYALAPDTIISPETADLTGQDNWAGRALSIIGRQQGDGIAPWASFNITAFAPLTGTYTLDRDPVAAGVEVNDVFVVCTLGVDNSANPYLISDPGLSNATNVPPHTGETPNDPNRVGQMIRVVKGTSRGMSAKIVSNTATSYTVDQALPIDATSVWILVSPAWNYSQDVIINNANPSQTTLTAIEINNYNGLALLVEGVTIDNNGVIIDDSDAPGRMLYIPGVQGTTSVAS